MTRSLPLFLLFDFTLTILRSNIFFVRRIIPKYDLELVGAGLRAGMVFQFGPAGTPGPTRSFGVPAAKRSSILATAIKPWAVYPEKESFLA
jgi:hypothetical protein